jgi:hypothetical protein
MNVLQPPLAQVKACVLATTVLEESAVAKGLPAKLSVP